MNKQELIKSAIHTAHNTLRLLQDGMYGVKDKNVQKTIDLLKSAMKEV